MKKIIKYMAFILAVFLINISNINAEEYKGVIEKGEPIEGVYYYKTRQDTEEVKYPTHEFHEAAYIYRDSINHNIVYCIESWQHLTGATTNDYRVYDHNVKETNLSDSLIDELNLVAYYGYGYKDDKYDHTSPEWYAVTQALIWQLQAPNYRHYITNSISSTKQSFEYDKKINELKKLVSVHKWNLFLSNIDMEINTVEEEEEKTGNLKFYEIDKYDEGIDVSIEGQKVIIKSLNKAGNFSYSLRRKFNKWNKKMKIYVSDKYQNVLEPGDMEDDVVTKNVKVKDHVLSFIVYALVPQQYTEDKRNVSRSYFFPDVEVTIKVKKDIYDGAGNLIYKKGSIYSTEKSTVGYSNIHVPSGAFELETITNIPGFKSAQKIVEINDKDESTILVLDMSKFVFNLDKTLEVMQDNGTVSHIPGQNISFGLYANEDIKNIFGGTFLKKDQLLATFNTDEHGKIHKTQSFILPGKYYLKEITELDDYELNNQKYEVTLSYPEEYQDSIELEEIKVENKLKTGKVEITKLDANKHFPLENVTYSLYSKDKSLIETKSTNVDGKINFNVKVGEYFIKENTALDGYLKDNKTYYIKVDHANLNPTYKLLNEKIENEKEPDKPTEPEIPEEPKDPEEPKEEIEKPIEKPEDKIEIPEDKEQPIIPEDEDKEPIGNRVDEEPTYDSNEEEGLIVNVPSTNVYNYFSILLFLLSITIISLRICLKD